MTVSLTLKLPMIAKLCTPRNWQVLFWLNALAVLILSLMPPVPQMPGTGWDKANHLLAFSVLAVLGLNAFAGRRTTLLLGLLAYGALIEILQSCTSYRAAEWADLFTDTLGIALGWALWRSFPRARVAR